MVTMFRMLLYFLVIHLYGREKEMTKKYDIYTLGFRVGVLK